MQTDPSSHQVKRSFVHKSGFFGLLAVFALATSSLWGQGITTSALSARVVDADGNGIASAKVILTHGPTGSEYDSVTSGRGFVGFNGLRVGGPYSLTVSAPGYSTEEQKGIMLELSKSFDTKMTLKQDMGEVVELEEFVTTAGPTTIFDVDTAGTGSVINRERIEDTATVQRSITDFARLNPLVTMNDTSRQEITAAGQNNRFNSIKVDGLNLNDQFGLESNGVSAIKNPISIDTIEEFSVDIAPYDVRQSGFTGASINAVTKSGRNTFFGSAYFYYTDQDLRAENPTSGIKEPFDEMTYGVTLGGPIIKDTLFFFLNYEQFDRTAQAGDPGFTPAPADVARIQARSMELGFDPGTFRTVSATQEEEKILAKIDWNITRDHRFSIRYDQNQGNQPDFGEYTDYSSSRPETALTSHFFTDDRKVTTFVAELNSFWTDSLQSQVRYGNTDIKKVPQLQLPYFPEIEVKGVSGITQAGTVTDRGEIFFGTEDSRQSNSLESQIENMLINFDYYMNEWTFSAGVDSEKSKFDNLFLQDTFGNYVYNSIEDFENDQLAYGNRQFGIEGQSVAAQSDFTITGIYGQAEWRATPALTIQGGIRVDLVSTSKSPPFAQHFYDSFGIRNDETIGGKTIVAPRLSFKYSPESMEGLQFRGGVGLFQGRAPAVYLSNSFSNNGVTTAYVRADSDTFKLEDVVNGSSVNPVFNFDPANPRVDLPPGTPGNRVDMIEEGLQLPAVWRANLAMDKKMPFLDTILTAELVFTEVEAAVYVADINLDEIGTTPDGRTLFNGASSRGNGIDPAFSNVYELRNSGGGSATNFVLSLNRPMKDNWYGGISYTYGVSDDVSSLTSSTAYSNFNNRAVFNQNTDEEGTSNYQVRHRFLANVGYVHDWGGNNRTRIALLYEGRSGRPYSVIYGTDVNGDGTDYNDLLYVPTGPGDPLVSFASAEDEAAFFNYVNENGLGGYAGSHAPRNTQVSAWVNRFDLKLVQEIPIGETVKTELFFDLLNLGNLINSDWGVVDEVPFSFTEEVVDAEIVDGQYVYEFLDPQGPTIRTSRSRWAMQLGVKVSF